MSKNFLTNFCEATSSHFNLKGCYATSADLLINELNTRRQALVASYFLSLNLKENLPSSSFFISNVIAYFAKTLSADRQVRRPIITLAKASVIDGGGSRISRFSSGQASHPYIHHFTIVCGG
jgi:hypothetical protein